MAYIYCTRRISVPAARQSEAGWTRERDGGNIDSEGGAFSLGSGYRCGYNVSLVGIA